MMERKQATTDTNVNGTDKKRSKFNWRKACKRGLQIAELCFAGIGVVGVGSLAYDKFSSRKGPKPPTDISSGPEI